MAMMSVFWSLKLLWGQLVTTVPTRKIPKILSWGRGHPEEYTEAIAISEKKFDVDSDKKPRAGQILWILALTRNAAQYIVCTVPWPPCPLSDITYIDEDMTASRLSPQQLKTERDDYAGAGNRLLSPYALRPPSFNPQLALSAPGNSELRKSVHETRIIQCRSCPVIYRGEQCMKLVFSVTLSY
ncbi:hypothetical protein FQA39_LY00518 [Lamprigera yunnana]|nr:hypothetical protein FQA39_LY00518 [Lamprigera yunnana]